METDKRMPYHFGQRVEKTKNTPLGWVDVNLEDVNINTPALFCFGGNGTVENRQANGNAKYVSGLLEKTIATKNVPVYSVVYGSKPLDTTGSVTYGELEEIAKTLFIKRVTDKNGNKLDIKKAQKNMRNVNITTHCYGQNVVKEMLSFCANYMEYNLFYKPNEIMNILKQVLVVSYAPMSKSSALSTNVEFISLKDNTCSYIKEYKQKNGDKIPNNTAGVLETENNTTIVCAQSFISEQSIDDEHLLSDIAKYKNLNKRSKIVLNAFETALSTGIKNSIQNCDSQTFTPLPSAKQFANLIEPILNEYKNEKNVKTVSNELCK